MKLKTIYICKNCEFSSPKWSGKCPQCDSWNSFMEDVVSTDSLKKERTQRSIKSVSPTRLSATPISFERSSTGIGEWDRVLGGGMVQGSLVLLGGEPGIGKSTLILQIAHCFTEQGQKVLYISGEESTEQIAMRAKRLGIQSGKSEKSQGLLLLNETLIESILATLKEEKPQVVILDSIQVMASQEVVGLQGSVTQVRACTEALMEYAKSTATSILIIGHVTKEGHLAGPKTLEHLVDAVLYLEGDRYQDLRILRGVKNRFGATSEIGIFEMSENGFKEVSDPSKAFLEHHGAPPIGSCLTVTLEGSRPFLIEVQALTNPTPFGYPKRATSGFDLNRLQLLLAVLQKHGGVDLSQQDVYVNVTGGMKVKDPAADLAVCLAIVSSHKKKAIPIQVVALGEVGLSGAVRKVAQLERREKEMKRMGLKSMNLKHLREASSEIS